MRKLMIALISLAAVLLAAGCGPTPTPTPPGESLEWEEMGQHDGSANGYQYQGFPKIEIITGAQEAAILEGQVYPSTLSSVTDTNFATYFVIAVFQGAKGYADYSVEVTDVRRDGNVIAVYAKFLTPPTPAPGEIVALKPIATSPYCVLKVRKTEGLCGDFTFVLTANGEEIMRQQHSIP